MRERNRSAKGGGVMVEPKIRINGILLSVGASMTLRVALESFAGDLSEPDSLGSDEAGVKIRAGYLDQISVIRNLMFDPPTTNTKDAENGRL